MKPASFAPIMRALANVVQLSADAVYHRESNSLHSFAPCLYVSVNDCRGRGRGWWWKFYICLTSGNKTSVVLPASSCCLLLCIRVSAGLRFAFLVIPIAGMGTAMPATQKTVYLWGSVNMDLAKEHDKWIEFHARSLHIDTDDVTRTPDAKPSLLWTYFCK